MSSNAERQARWRERRARERETLQREIERLRQATPDQARIAELEAENARLVAALRNAGKSRKGKVMPRMPRNVFSLILKCVHPDQRDNRSAADLDEACKRLTAWWATQK